MSADENDRERAFAALLHHGGEQRVPGDSLALPLVSASAYHLPGEPEAPFTYGRVDNPTWRETEAALARVEGAPCVLFASGMAAITAALAANLSSGETLLLPSDGYYMTRRLVADELTRYGVAVREIETTALADATLEDVSLVIVECPSNPTLDLVDLELLARRCRTAGALLVVDNTTCTGLIQRPLEHGADLVVAADTKAPGGHGDLLLGHVAAHDDALLERVRRWRTTTGSIPGSFEAWLLHRSLQTLELRLARMCDNADALVARLAERPDVVGLRFPGLASHPGHALARRQMHRHGFLIGFELADAGTAERFIDACECIDPATSFGSVHTTAERRARWGDAVAAGFVRLSVGCEPTGVLCDAIESALTRATTAAESRS